MCSDNVASLILYYLSFKQHLENLMYKHMSHNSVLPLRVKYILCNRVKTAKMEIRNTQLCKMWCKDLLIYYDHDHTYLKANKHNRDRK